MAITSLPPLSLYIHIPWCIRKCPYCDFNSHRQPEQLPEDDYVAALIEDLKQDLAYVQGRSLQSIFFGGGTPSLFSASAIGDILDGIATEVTFSPNIEITLEANPGTFEQDKFSGFRHAGVNRLSIGIQSFNSGHLQQLGRVHDGEEAINAIAVARQAGFDNINLDLMHGLPGQSVDDALKDLQTAIDHQPEHLSWYQLTIEPNTEFYKHPPLLPQDETLWNIFEQGRASLNEAGYQQYEVSAYAQPGRQAAHNLNYWRFGDYLGIGAGAHGKLTGIQNNTLIRSQKTRSPKDYLNPDKTFCATRNPIDSTELAGEFMMNALRLWDGFSPELFTQTTGLPLSVINEPLVQAEADGLLAYDSNSNQTIAATAKGQLFLNNLVGYFI